MIKSYEELQKFKTFLERFEYLKLQGAVGTVTFGYDRYLNQVLYKSRRWLKARNEVIIRDNGCDLGIPGFELYDKVIVHHINPITIADVESGTNWVYNPNFLICTSEMTHKAIHYSDAHLLPKPPVERHSGDTTPWR